MLYLDHAATTPLRPEACEAMAPYLADEFGNPSGIHGIAREAKLALEDARERAAALIGAAHPLEIVFTGGGTESDNLGVAGPVLAAGRGAGIVTTAVEHEAVLETARFLERLGHPLSVIGVDAAGRVDPGAVAAAVDAETVLVSVMAANNETGVKQPLAEIAALVAELPGGTRVHTDAVQHFVSEDVRVDEWAVDLLTLASHKFGGPKGVGLLYVRDGVELEPVLHGGGQEVGRRSGTHNVAGIVGMVAAMEAAAADRGRFRAEVGAARERFETRLAVGLGAAVTAGNAPRLIQHSHLRIPGISAETLLILLDRLGLAAAAGSACHSGAVQVSPVLAAMGLSPAAAAGCVRFTFGWTTRPEDGEEAAALVLEAAGGVS